MRLPHIGPIGVLLLLVLASITGCEARSGSDADLGTAPTTAVLAENVVEMGNDHPAVGNAAQSTTQEEFAAEAGARGLRFMCAEGGPGGNAPKWQVCMLRAEGIVAIVGFGDTSGMRTRFTGATTDGVVVPLEAGSVFGVLEPEGRVRLEIEFEGRQIGQMRSAVGL